MSDVAWQIEHSVETTAGQDFAWKFMSNVVNWDDPPAQFTLFGPFVTGTHGSTQVPGQPAQRWVLQQVTPMESYTIEFFMDRAGMLFEWRFTPLPNGRTRLTQHAELRGENAATYLAVVEQALAAGLAPGMRRIAAAMDLAYTSR
jgi:hypothetical protein